MFFADDCYIFCKANLDSTDHVLQMLNVFERASGQQINVDKSLVCFSRNTNKTIKQELCRRLRFREAGDDFLYLGLPNVMGRKKTAIFDFLKEKLRMNGWDKMLSKGGKEILLKTVSQGMPNYAMSVFMLPQEICSELEKSMCKFWWKTSPKKDRNIHWMSWKNMCRKKASGGLGFRSIRDFYIALLGKQVWRLLMFSDRLFSKVYKAGYYPHGSIIKAKVGGKPSYIWRSIVEAQAVVKQEISCRIGDGNNVSILEEPWLSNAEDPYIHFDMMQFKIKRYLL